jgi:predicted AlkP superfamily phosphohydrolase/phosphomutase
VHLGFIRDQTAAAMTWHARPLWLIASEAGVRVGIVRWPLTYPAEEVDGFIVSDRFHQLLGSIAEFDGAVTPRDVLPTLETSFSELSTSSQSTPGVMGTPEESALRRDRWYSRAMRDLAAGMSPRLTAVRYEGLDTVGHYYLRYTLPRTFRDLPEEERRRFSQVIDRYYTYIDGEVGASLAGLTPDDLLVVVSGFGMQPLNPVKQTIGRLLGDPDYSGTHERAPDGFLMAYGSAVEPGRRPRGSIVDVTPTVLYFLGLPAARDMDGFARADLFTRAFTADRPIVFIPSYR